MAQLLETVYQEKKPVVDRQAGTISRVKLLGNKSKNNREYTEQAKKSAARLYLGAKNYVNHGLQNGQVVERSLEDWASVITAVNVESDGVYGVLKLRKESPHFGPLMEAADDPDFYKAFGMSHVANGDSHFDRSGLEIVEDVTEVRSVDYVTTPAHGGHLSESAGITSAKRILRTEIEALPAGTTRTKLIEMMGDGGYLDGGMTPSDDSKSSDPMAQMASIVKTLIAQLGDALNKLAAKEASPPPPPATPNPPNPDAPDAPEEEMNADPAKAAADKEAEEKKKLAFESLQRENAELKARNTLLESGREATPARVKALANAAEADRKELLESWAPLPESERPLRSPAALHESAGETGKYEAGRDLKSFASALR